MTEQSKMPLLTEEEAASRVASLRERIDRVDQLMAEALLLRRKLSREARQVKFCAQMPLVDLTREREIAARWGKTIGEDLARSEQFETTDALSVVLGAAYNVHYAVLAFCKAGDRIPPRTS